MKVLDKGISPIKLITVLTEYQAISSIFFSSKSLQSYHHAAKLGAYTFIISFIL